MAVYPEWLNTQGEYNLRLVGKNLAVGAFAAPELHLMDGRRSIPWACIVDLYGSSKEYDTSHGEAYKHATVMLRFPFEDGNGFPPGALDAIKAAVRAGRKTGPVLIHCAAGMSRSVSAAYAMLRVLDGLSHEAALERVRDPEQPNFPMRTTLASARRWVEGQG